MYGLYLFLYAQKKYQNISCKIKLSIFYKRTFVSQHFKCLASTENLSLFEVFIYFHFFKLS